MSRALWMTAVAMACLVPAADGQESLLPEGRALKTEKDLRALSESALERLMRGQSGGFDVLKEHSVDTGDEEALDRFFRSQADRVKNFIRRWGEPLEYKLIARHCVGDVFCRHVYLCKYEKNFLCWKITYYRPRQAWFFFRLDFDDDVNALFAEAGAAAGGGVEAPARPAASSKPRAGPAR